MAECFPGDIQIAKKHGIVILFLTDIICLNKICADADSLKTAKLVPKAPLFLNHNKIGTCTGINFSSSSQALVCHFNLKSTDILDNASYYVGIPNIQANELQCCVCRKVFYPGSLSCNCINRSPVLIVRKFVIESITLLDSRTENILEQDSRAKILLDYFGGALSGLEL